MTHHDHPAARQHGDADENIAPATAPVREAHDARDERKLAHDPASDEGKLEVGLDESFPSSDPPAAVQPGGGEPAPSSGYDEEAEKRRRRPQ